MGPVFIPDSLGYWFGTNYFGTFSLKVGRHFVAMFAMTCVAFGAFIVIDYAYMTLYIL